MGKVGFLLLVLTAVLFVPWIHQLIHSPLPSDPVQPQKIHLSEVLVTSYREDGTVQSTIQGEHARMGMKLEDVELTPARAEMFRDGILKAWITGREGRKLTGEDGKERYEFENNVLGQSADGKQLVGRLVEYLVKTEEIIAPEPVTLLSTDTKITGDSLQAHSTLDHGSLTGNVEIVHLEPTKEGEAEPAPLDATGEQAFFDFKAGKHRLRGNTKVHQAKMRQTADQVEFLEAEKLLVSVGRVHAVDDDTEIWCEQLTYGLESRRSRAQGSPRIRQTDPKTGVAQEMTAKEIMAHSGERWIIGKGDVTVVTRDRAAKTGVVETTTITADEGEDSLATGRATFKGRVVIRSPKGVSKGRTAVYYRNSRKAYVSGEAEAWKEGPGGQKTDQVRGEHIIYYVDSGQSVALGDVKAVLGGEQSGGELR